MKFRTPPLFSLRHKLPSFFKKPSVIVLLLVYIGILVAIYLASPPPGQAFRPVPLCKPPGPELSGLIASIYIIVCFILVVLLFTLKRKEWRELKPLNGINPLWFFFVMGFSIVLADLIETTFSGHTTPTTPVGATILNTVGYIVPGALVSMPLIVYSYIWKKWNRRAVHVGIVLLYISMNIAIMLYQRDFAWVVCEKTPGAFLWVGSLYFLYSVPFIAVLLTKNIRQRIAVVLAILVLFVAFHQLMYVHQFPQRSLLKLSVDVKDVPRSEITVDGDFSDWSGFQPIFIDPRGDSVDPSLDVREIFAATNGRELFFAVKTIEPLQPASPNKGIYVDLDTDLDYERDYFVSDLLKDRNNKVIAQDNFMANKGKGFIEFRVPLESIKIGVEKIAINVVAVAPYGSKEWETYDESDWIFLRIKKEA